MAREAEMRASYEQKPIFLVGVDREDRASAVWMLLNTGLPPPAVPPLPTGMESGVEP